VREALVAAQDAPETIDRFRVVIEALASEYDVMDVAAAAVKVAHEATAGDGPDEDVEIPTVTVGEYKGRSGNDRSATRFGRNAPRSGGGGSGSYGRERPAGRERHGFSEPYEGGPGGGGASRGRPAESGDYAAGRPPRQPRSGAADGNWTTTRVYVGAGRKMGIRPADLVGAIANEAGIEARAIGAIEITDRFSLVEVPEAVVDNVVDALRGTTIKGKRVVVRRDRA
jgi:ATP-dependent RNA helicase DeaD